MAILLVLEVSNVRRRIKNIIFNSKKHQVVGQFVLEKSIKILVLRAKAVEGKRRVDGRRGMMGLRERSV